MRHVNMFVIVCKYVDLFHFHTLLHISFFIVFNCHHFCVLYESDGLICFTNDDGNSLFLRIKCLFPFFVLICFNTCSPDKFTPDLK